MKLRIAEGTHLTVIRDHPAARGRVGPHDRRGTREGHQMVATPCRSVYAMAISRAPPKSVAKIWCIVSRA
jgi:hypothetical protein